MRLRILAALAVLLVLAGCVCFPRQRRYRSSLFDYLAPRHVMSQGRAARLQLPLKIGIAFVPAEPAPVDAQGEERLLAIVQKAFKGRDWVGSIQTIPSKYLMPHGGYDNLQQVAGLMNVDVIALVSVDQIQYDDPTMLSILYLTVVGEYLLPGDRNDTRTMIDVAVLDVNSRSLLLRAPGTSRVRGITTPIAAERNLRAKSGDGMRLAMVDLTKNLDEKVGSFKADVVSGQRADVDIVTREGKSLRGGGALDPFSAVLLLSLAGLTLIRRRA
jgi:rhombotail lipoprotein